LEQIDENVAAGRKEENILYIFGHSLNETDGDVLREFITHNHIKTIIYYKDKRQLGQQIANLVKILKSDNMIAMVYGNQPRITFQEQHKRELIKGSPFEIASDTMKLSDIYRWDDLEAQILLTKIQRKIKQNELDYFQSQRAVITLFDVLQKNGLEGMYAKKLLSIAYSLMRIEGIYEAEQYDSEDWAYQDYDDFGVGRDFGYKRQHLGHDMMGLVGTPIIAVESGYVEALGWNRYGGWRIGIRSFDKKRYYYYAHLRQNRPYAEGLKEGDYVTAGDVIGYMGHTGYSDKENVNNIKTVHLHVGLQLIFDESQKDGNNEIWVDFYQLAGFLSAHRCEVERNEVSKEWDRKYDMKDPAVPAEEN